MLADSHVQGHRGGDRIERHLEERTSVAITTAGKAPVDEPDQTPEAVSFRVRSRQAGRSAGAQAFQKRLRPDPAPPQLHRGKRAQDPSELKKIANDLLRADPALFRHITT